MLTQEFSIPIVQDECEIHIEAENYTAMYGIQLENTSDVGGGKTWPGRMMVIGWITQSTLQQQELILFSSE
jgi:hypothetical protein